MVYGLHAAAGCRLLTPGLEDITLVVVRTILSKEFFSHLLTAQLEPSFQSDISYGAVNDKIH